MARRSQIRVRDARTGRFVSLNDLSMGYGDPTGIPGYLHSGNGYLIDETTGHKIRINSAEGKRIVNAYYGSAEQNPSTKKNVLLLPAKSTYTQEVDSRYQRLKSDVAKARRQLKELLDAHPQYKASNSVVVSGTPVPNTCTMAGMSKCTAKVSRLRNGNEKIVIVERRPISKPKSNKKKEAV